MFGKDAARASRRSRGPPQILLEPTEAVSLPAHKRKAQRACACRQARLGSADVSRDVCSGFASVLCAGLAAFLLNSMQDR